MIRVFDLAYQVATEPRPVADPHESSFLASLLVTFVPLVLIVAMALWLFSVIRRQQDKTNTALSLAEQDLALQRESLEELRAIRKLLESQRG